MRRGSTTVGHCIRASQAANHRGGPRTAHRKHAGFTLIELMIVVTIIAIIAGIAIPNLLQARISGNESSCAASLRAYINAQGIYHRQDRDDDGLREYASDLDQLYYINGITFGLIDRKYAEADDDPNVQPGSNLGNSFPRNGYIFRDLIGRADGTDFVLDPEGNGYVDGFGLWGYPYRFNRSGRFSMVISTDGTVYGRVIEDIAGDGDWSADRYPDITINNWLPMAD